MTPDADNSGSKIRAGKLPPEMLEDVLSRFKPDPAHVVVGPGIGLDAAVIRTPSPLMAVTSDPITLAADLIAYYCVHVNANDLAAMGADPQFMIAVCLLPVGQADLIQSVASDLARYAGQLNINVIGGHTELTAAVNSPVMVATMLGRVVTDQPIGAAGARVGDLLIMTGQAALEATAIAAREKPDRLRAAGLADSQIQTAQNLLFDPGISVLPQARIAIRNDCSAMHDATEGGMVSAVWEMARAADVRIQLQRDRIPVSDLTRRICAVWDIDPLAAISSGSLLIAIPAAKADPLIEDLQRSGIPAAVIGQMIEGNAGVEDAQTAQPIYPVQDQIARIYEP